jgi:cobalt-zinc-cadmium efflux system protein
LAIGLALNAGFVAVEALFGAAAHSVALMSDAVHNLGDARALGVAWLASALAQRAPSARFTYGLRLLARAFVGVGARD